MGMDVYGKHPADSAGEYFRNNVWWWRPLANYVQEIAPQIAAHCKSWHTNDGAGLNKRDSLALADILQAEIDSGRCALFASAREASLQELPDETCDLCDGTGVRKEPPERGAGNAITGIKCNACDGKGTVRPRVAQYPFSVENVQEFVAFLRSCGGFQIC